MTSNSNKAQRERGGGAHENGAWRRGAPRTIGTLRRRARVLLADAPGGSPTVEFRALLARAAAPLRDDDSRSAMAAAMGDADPVPPRVWHQVMRAARRRRRGVPLAYILGYKEFYGLTFAVNRHTLIPRPESELLVELACEYARQYDWEWVHDCGAGSGNIAIAVRHAAPQLRSVSASDRSAAALRVARRNCRALLGAATAVEWWRARGVRWSGVDAIVANLPYVRRHELREPSIGREPRMALHGGGPHGTRVIERVIAAAAPLLSARGALLLECAPHQIARLRAALMRHSFARVTVHRDLAGRERVLVGWRAERGRGAPPPG